MAKIVLTIRDTKKSKQKRKRRRRQSDACGEIRAAVVRRCWQ